MEIEQTEVTFVIEKNGGNGKGYSITENPNTEHEVVRSPFNSVKEARKREIDIAEYWGFKAVELKKRICKCPTDYHTMFQNCRGY